MIHTTKTISDNVGCNKETIRTYLGNWRFNKYRQPTRPETYDVNEDFVKDFLNFVKLRPFKKWHNNVNNIYMLITP
jgi:hypothetical protein